MIGGCGVGRGAQSHEDFRVGVVCFLFFLVGGQIVGTEIKRVLMMMMVMEARGHFLKSLCLCCVFLCFCLAVAPPLSPKTLLIGPVIL